jgi:hypothetical protein
MRFRYSCSEFILNTKRLTYVHCDIEAGAAAGAVAAQEIMLICSTDEYVLFLGSLERV